MSPRGGSAVPRPRAPRSPLVGASDDGARAGWAARWRALWRSSTDLAVASDPRICGAWVDGGSIYHRGWPPGLPPD